MRRQFRHSRRGAQGVAGLSLSEVDYLLTGRGRTREELEALPARTTYDEFTQFCWWVDWRGLWQAHRGALLEEWRRRAGIGEPWAARQFDEVVSD